MIITDEKLLRQKSYPVTSVEEAKDILLKLAKEMENHETAIGLSAIQIGINKRVSLVRTKAGSFPLINPSITELDESFVFWGEGCLSFPDQYSNTTRFKSVIIENSVIEGDSFRTETQYYQTEDPQKDVTAIAIQHEIDHLDGLIFRDRIAECKPIVSDGKIGRNEPCPCGSGKKYKKCCATKE